MNNPAFDYLRQFKKVSTETEELVIKTIKRKYNNLTMSELTDIFELGITGEFGKVYAADPETLLSWIEDYIRKKSTSNSYYETDLLDSTIHVNDVRYPSKMESWQKEVNKAFTKWLGGTSYKFFHPHLYDRLLVDNKIQKESFQEFGTDNIRESKQKYLDKYFKECKSNGQTKIYPL